MKREKPFLSGTGEHTADPAERRSTRPGADSRRQQLFPVCRRKEAAWICLQALLQLVRGQLQQTGELPIHPQDGQRAAGLRPQQTQPHGHLVQHPSGSLLLGEGLPQRQPLPAEPVDVPQNGPENRDAPAGGDDLCPQTHPDRTSVCPKQAEVLVGCPALPGRIQQLLQQGGPVRRLHKGGKTAPPLLQQDFLAPAAQLAQLAVAGPAAQALPAQLQRGAGKRIRQGRLPLGRLSGPLRIQKERHDAVHHLIAGDGQSLPCRSDIGEGGRGPGECHCLHRRKDPRRRQGRELGQPPVLDLLRRQLQQSCRGRIQKTADQIHDVAGAVGQCLCQHKGNGAVLKRTAELVQVLCHRRRLPAGCDAPIIKEGRSRGNEKWRIFLHFAANRATFAKMHKK